MKSPSFPLYGFWCVCLWPLINFLSTNYAEIRSFGFFAWTWQIVALVCIIAIVGTVASVALSKLTGYSAAVFLTAATLIVAAFFLFPIIEILHVKVHSAIFKKILGQPWTRSTAAISAPITFALLTIPIAGVGILIGLVPRLRNGIAVLAIVSLTASISALALSVSAAPNITKTSAATISTTRTLSGKNVYYVIVDGYTSAEVLRSELGFDNRPFLEEMKADGFFEVESARSNYLMTRMTLSSIFLMDYALLPEQSFDLKNLYPQFFQSAQKPKLVSDLISSGYNFFIAPLDIFSCPGHDIKCVDGSGLIDYSTMIFLKNTPVYALLTKYVTGRSMLLDSLSFKINSLKTERPFFVFAHNLPPHPPFLYHADCQKREGDVLDLDNWDAKSRQLYIDSVTCVNRKIRGFVRGIIKDDPDAIIIIQGDHGSGFRMKENWVKPMATWPSAAINERAGFLNLIRAPDACKKWLRPDMAQINTIRFVMACLDGEEPNYVSEQTVLTTYNQSKEFGRALKFDPALQQGTGKAGLD